MLRVLAVVLALGLLAIPAAVYGDTTDLTVTVTPIHPPAVDSDAATDIGTTTARLHGEITDTGGEDAFAVGFEWGIATGVYTDDWTAGGSFGLGAFNRVVSGLPPDTEIFWRAFAENTAGIEYSAERSFFTLAYIGPPIDFTVTQAGPNSVEITWTVGIGATDTVIRGGEGGYPGAVTDGYLVYDGGGTSVVVDGVSLTSSAYYFRAWSYAGAIYSVEYAQGKIGGDMMALWLFGFLGLGLLGMFFWKRIAFLSYGAAGVWALMGFQALQASASGNPTQITDTYMALFWLSIGFVIACSLIPTLMREKPEPDDVYVDGVGDDVSSFAPESDKRPHSTRAFMSKFSRKGED